MDAGSRQIIEWRRINLTGERLTDIFYKALKQPYVLSLVEELLRDFNAHFENTDACRRCARTITHIARLQTLVVWNAKAMPSAPPPFAIAFAPFTHAFFFHYRTAEERAFSTKHCNDRLSGASHRDCGHSQISRLSCVARLLAKRACARRTTHRLGAAGGCRAQYMLPSPAVTRETCARHRQAR